jgi:hypothetical protein
MFRRTSILTLVLTTMGASLLFAQVAPTLKELRVEKAFVKELIVHGNFPNAFKVTAIDTADQPLAGVTVKGFVQTGDAQLYTTSAPDQTATAVTDAAGVATFSLATRTKTEAVILFIPKVGATDLPEKTRLFNLSASSGLATSLGSKRSYLQLFIGQTFKNAYEPVDVDEDPATAPETRNIGFTNGGPLIRLTFNTMWRDQNLSKPGDKKLLRSYKRGLWNTDANLEFSRFPFGDEVTEENKAGVDDAFSGSLGLSWQPNRWASYDERTEDDRRNDPLPFDAYRFGLFSKAGITTRLTPEADGNNSIYRFQVGLRFTHSRSKVSNAIAEDTNREPIRFVEASYGRFSEWGGQAGGANRLVIDAGLRITALGNEVFPVYVGGHINSGPGEDDLRLFLGVLMKLDVLGKLVQNVAPPPE